MNKRFSPALTILTTGLTLALLGCATNHPYEPQDPAQGFNRASFAFNEQFDRFILKPVAEGYQTITPTFVQNRVNDFYWNLTDITSTANNALQFKMKPTFYSGMRFVINSTFGVFGLFDVAGDVGMVRKENDFGTTLSVWGVTSAPYLVIPFIGPSNARDGLGMGVDLFALSIWPYMHSTDLRNILLGIDYVRIRANLLKNEGIVDAGALDRYTFIRDAYFQYRQAKLEENGGTWDESTKYYGQNQEDLDLDSIESEDMAVEPPLSVDKTFAPHADASTDEQTKTAAGTAGVTQVAAHSAQAATTSSAHSTVTSVQPTAAASAATAKTAPATTTTVSAAAQTGTATKAAHESITASSATTQSKTAT